MPNQVWRSCTIKTIWPVAGCLKSRLHRFERVYNLCRNDCLHSNSCAGFLTGGRRASFQALPQEEQDIQQEAYGHVTVALTRARSLCIIMRPQDMKALLGAATVIGSHGAGHVFKGQVNFYLHDDSLGNSPPNTEFGQLLSGDSSTATPQITLSFRATYLHDGLPLLLPCDFYILASYLCLTICMILLWMILLYFLAWFACFAVLLDEIHHFVMVATCL